MQQVTTWANMSLISFYKRDSRQGPLIWNDLALSDSA